MVHMKNFAGFAGDIDGVFFTFTVPNLFLLIFWQVLERRININADCLCDKRHKIATGQAPRGHGTLTDC